MAKIVTLYATYLRNLDAEHGRLFPIEMSYIRWFKISEALARLGHEVDMATAEFKWYQRRASIVMGKNLRRVPLSGVKWNRYDVVKTLFHRGFHTLELYGGTAHPFIISKLGSVVGSDNLDGIYFYGREREELYSIQEKVNRASRYVTVLSEPAKELWETSFGKRDNVLIVPGATERDVPPPLGDPYPKGAAKRCIFSGNIYSEDSQPQAHRVIVEKLNRLGELLLKKNIRLYLLGEGDTRKIDRNYVTCLGFVEYDRSWDYLYFADVGIVLIPGKFLHNNESTKVYHYLRAGLPVVAESGLPNERVIMESKLGLIADNGDLEAMAERIFEAGTRDWDRNFAVSYVLNTHTWDERARIYDKLIRSRLK